jgi:hypothetical protein
MAEAVVSAVVADAVGRAMTLLARRLRDRWGVAVEGKLRRLQHLVVKLESAVETADARRIASRALLEWLSELADGVHRGRYFLDAFSGDEAADEDEGDGHGDGGMRRVLFSPSSFNPAKRLRVAVAVAALASSTASSRAWRASPAILPSSSCCCNAARRRCTGR